MNKRDVTLSDLAVLGLTTQEANIYIELLTNPATHAQLSSITGINRTTLYRLVNKLHKKGLLTLRTDDRGKFLVAADPSTLEVEVVNQETRATLQRKAFGQLLPELQSLQADYEADFAIQTYKGIDGFKRMLWHELKTKGDCLCIGSGTLQELVKNLNWAEKHRQLSVEAGYTVREICNPGTIPSYFTSNKNFLATYKQRTVPHTIIKINYMITTYNDTVAIYHMNNGHRRGLEIISKPYAETIRSMFEVCWLAGTDS